MWARDLEREKKPPTLSALMSWMTVEMKSRMHATAPIRVSRSNRKQINHLQGNQNKDDQAWYKCWLCKNSSTRRINALSLQPSSQSNHKSESLLLQMFEKGRKGTYHGLLHTYTTVHPTGEWDTMFTTSSSAAS